MGFFDRFSKGGRGKPAETPAQDSVSEYSGMRVEVMNDEKELLSIARLIVSMGVAELQRVGDGDSPADREEAPAGPVEGEQPVHVTLRGFDRVQQKAIHMEGDINQADHDTWRLEKLKVVSKNNDRAFYRQNVDVPGEVRLLDRSGTRPMEPCKLVNISAGGVCLQSETEFAVGDTLFLRSRLLPTYELLLYCTVCRVTPRRGNIKEYGCKFENMDVNAEDQIAKAIFEIQSRHRKL